MYSSVHFTPSLGCAGHTAWVLFTGNDQAMFQRPYVIYRTLNNGKTWTPVFAEGYFTGAYPPNVRKINRGIGSIPGPFVVLNPQTAYFIGLTPPAPDNKEVQFTGTVDAGKHWRTSFIPCLNALWPITVKFAGPSHGWVAGTCLHDKHAIVATANGGRRWTVQTRKA